MGTHITHAEECLPMLCNAHRCQFGLVKWTAPPSSWQCSRQSICVRAVTSTSHSRPAQTVSPPSVVKIGPARVDEAGHIARICTEAFDIGGLSSNGTGHPSSFASRVSATLKRSIEADVEDQIRTSIAGKKEAGNEARTLLLERESQRMRSELAALREGRNIVVPLRLSPLERARLQKLRRRRMCTCFVARVGGAGGEPVGCALASFLAPEAALPPPWPTAKPLRLYMSNLAVLPEHQRRGVAAALLRACEVLGRRWGQDSLWLHTYSDNKGAIALYERSGYTLHSERRRLSSLWTGKKERLYVKYLQQLSRSEDAESGEVVSVSGSVRASDGAFVWDAVSARETTRL